ncbi:hypothetical protein [Wolbachia endosymbiont (group B) of Episyrphus balteatus]|nr:hypothetical protein [Wolbachia endosymbiont (group B) of Episyrphus balteatus]
MIRFQEGAVSSQTSCVAEINFGRTAMSLQMKIKHLLIIFLSKM